MKGFEMLEQTKRAKEMMLKAGFNRSDFSVNVERYYIPNSVKNYGKPMFEYGYAQIAVKSSSAYKSISCRIMDIIMAGLGVDEYRFGEKRSWHITTKHNKHQIYLS